MELFGRLGAADDSAHSSTVFLSGKHLPFPKSGSVPASRVLHMGAVVQSARFSVDGMHIKPLELSNVNAHRLLSSAGLEDGRGVALTLAVGDRLGDVDCAGDGVGVSALAP